MQSQQWKLHEEKELDMSNTSFSYIFFRIVPDIY